tara:strand:+ start:100 stop:510 length:411 start_codon:yes stop_codon:yes gene_type:complete
MTIRKYFKICLYFSVISTAGFLLYFLANILYESVHAQSTFNYGTISESEKFKKNSGYLWLAKDTQTASLVKEYINTDTNKINFDFSKTRLVKKGSKVKILKTDSEFLYIEAKVKNPQGDFENQEGFIAKEFVEMNN